VLVLVSLSVACSRQETLPEAGKASANSGSAASQPAPVPQSRLPDPCALLTKAEAESILGGPVKDPQPNSLGGNKICDYNTIKLYGGIAPYSVHIAITPETQQVWDAGKKLHADAKESRPVAGLGDDAYFILDGLDILSDGRSISVTVTKDIDRPTHQQSVQDAERAVAETILPRMK
jgi:hypothetical protein